MAIVIGNSEQEQEFEKKVNEIFPAESSFTIGNRTINFTSSHIQMENGATRIVITNADDKDTDSLYIDARPVPNNPNAVLLDYSEKGSAHKRAVTNEIYFNSQKPNLAKGDLKVRTAFEVLRDTAYGSFYLDKFRASTQQGRFNWLATHGSPEQKLVGGWLNVSPFISSRALQSLTRNVTVGFGPSVKKQDEALSTISSWINSRGTQPSPYYADYMQDLAGLVPYKSSDGRTRLRPANESVPQENEAGEYNFWLQGDVAKLNLSRAERDMLTMSKRNPDTGLLEDVVPKIITQMGVEGTSRLNIQRAGEEFAPAAVVSQNVLSVPGGGLPDSGARIVYGQTATEAEEEFGPFYETRKSTKLHVSGLTELQNTSFEWGIYEKEKDDNYVRKDDLVGYVMTPGQKVIMGLKTVIGGDGNKTVTPIEYKNTNRETKFSGYPTLHLPPAVNDIDKDVRFAPIAGNVQSVEGEYQSRALSEKELQKLKANMGGGEVSTNTISNVSFSVPLGVANAQGEKGLGGTKQSVVKDRNVIGREPQSSAVNIGNQEVELQSITASVKYPLMSFLYGQVGTMPTQKIKQLVSEVYGKRSPLLKEINATINYQNDLLNNKYLTPKERSSQWKGVNIDKLAEIQGFGEAPILFVKDFRDRVRAAQKADPERFYNEYRMGQVRELQYVRYRTIHEAEIPFQRQRLRNATDLLTEENPLEFQKEEMDKLNDLSSPESRYKFTPIEGHPELYDWHVKTFGEVGPQAVSFTSEHQYKESPRFNLEQVMAEINQDPQGKKRFLSAAAELENRGVKSWARIGDYFKSLATDKVDIEGKPLTFETSSYTNLTDKQATDIGIKLDALEGNSPEAMQGVIDEVIGHKSGSILRLESSGLQLPAPKTVRGISEMEVIDKDLVANVDRFSKLYPRALHDFAARIPYSNAISEFGNTVYDALAATGGGIMQKTTSAAVIGKGGHAAGTAGLHPNVGVVSDSDMRRYILESLKADKVSTALNDVDTTNPSAKLNREQAKLLRQAYSVVRAQGGLPAKYTKSPPYTETDSIIPLILKDSRMLRDIGIDAPPNTRIENGRIVVGDSSLWGQAVGTGVVREALFADLDLDPAVIKIQAHWKKSHGRLQETSIWSEPFRGLLSQSGAEIAERLNRTLQSIEGGNNVSTASATLNELKTYIENTRSPEAMEAALAKDKLTQVTQQNAANAGITAMKIKSQMGKAYNVRRRFNAVMETNPEFSQEHQSSQYNALGLSYEKNLEKNDKVVLRGYEDFIDSLVPTSYGSGKWGFKYKKGENARGEPSFGETLSLDINQLGNAAANLTYEGVQKGVLSPDAALAAFSSNSDEYAQMRDEFNANPKNRSNVDEMYNGVFNIIEKRIKDGDFNFSKTNFGAVLATSFHDKLMAISRGAYRLPKNSPVGAGEKAVSHLLDTDITYQDNTMPIREFLEDPRLNASNILLKVMKRKTGTPLPEELDTLYQYAQNTVASSGKETKSLTEWVTEKFGAEAVSKTLNAPGVHEKSMIDLEAFRNYRPTPNELTKVLDENASHRYNTMLGIYAKTQLKAFGSISDYTGEDKTAMNLGTEFEDKFRDKIIAKNKYESTYSPKSNMVLGETGSVFGWTGGNYRPDLMGIDPKSGKFFIGDFKWVGSKDSARDMLKLSERSLPQITAYADAINRMAHPETYLQNWDKVKETLDGNPGETYFVNNFMEAVKQKNQFTADEEEKLRENAALFYHKIRGGGIELKTFAGHGDNKKVPMQYYGEKSWGTYSEQEAISYNDKAVQIMQHYTTQHLMGYATSLSEAIETAQKNGVETQPLPAQSKAILSETVNPHKTRGIRADNPNSSTNVNKTNDIGSGSGATGGGGNGGNRDTNNVAAASEDPKKPGGNDLGYLPFNQMASMFAQAVAPLLGGQNEEPYTRKYLRKEFDENILLGRFYSGHAAANELIDQAESLKNLPIDFTNKVSQGLLDAGVTPSVFYNQNAASGTGIYQSGGARKLFLGKKPPVPLMLSDFNKLKEANPTAYSRINEQYYGTSREINKLYKALSTGMDAGESLGLSAADLSNIREAQHLPNIAMALGLSGGLDKPENRPSTYIDSEENAAKVIGRFKSYVDDDVVGAFEKKLSQMDKTFDDVTESMKSFAESTEASVKVNEKDIKLKTELNEAQRDTIEQIKEGLNKPIDNAVIAKDAIYNAKEQVRRYDAGEVTAEESLKVVRAGIRGMQTISSTTRTLGEAEEGIEGVLKGEYPGAPASMGQTFRGAIGGFGLFYLKTLFSYGFGSYQKGYEATVKQKTLMNQMETNLYGAGQANPYISPELQNQRNLLIAGGNTWEQLQRNWNTISGSNTDISGAALSGLGTSAAVYHLAPFLGATAETLGLMGTGAAGAIAGVAGPIGLGAAALMFGTSIYSNAINYEDSIVSAASNYEKNKPFAAGTKLLGPILRDVIEGNYVTTPNTAGSYLAHMSPTVRVTEAKAITRQMEQDWDLANEGKFRRIDLQEKTDEERWRLIANWAGNPPDQLKQFSPEVVTQLLYSHTTGSEKTALDTNYLNQLKLIGQGMTAGRDVTPMAQQLSGLVGLGYQAGGDLIPLEAYLSKIGGAEFEKAKIGMGYMSNMPSALRDYSRFANKETNTINEAQLNEQFDKWVNISQSKYADLFWERVNVANAAMKTGVAIPINEDSYTSEVRFSPERIARETNQNQVINRQSQLRATLQQAGVSIGSSIGFTAAFQSPEELNFAERLLNFSPTAIGDYAQGLQASGQTGLANYFDRFALTDYNLQGQQTGLGHWATSLRGATSSAVQNANMIWGKGNWEDSELAQAAVYGINRDTGEIYKSGDAIPEGANVVGGQRGIQWQQFYLGIEQQNKQFDIQQRQLGLQEQYQPLFWAQEDKQREFSYRQQEWSFSQQEASMEMQNRHFQQNMAFQQKQSYMQRGWTAEDWGYQDLTRSMQWGWKQEDFAEQSRFMTGRERRIAERGMERETTLFNLESGQIDKTRDRQKQMWALEDERFAIQKEQYAEQRQFQEEALAKQREFFEEQKVLTEESVTLNRQYQTEQIALQKESLALQIEYAATQNENNKKLMELSDMEENMQGAFALAKEKQIEFFSMAAQGFEYLGTEFKQMIQSIISGTPYTAGEFGYGSGPDNPPGAGGGINVPELKANGGDMFPGMAYIVGEAGAERVRPRTLGSVVNQYDIAQTLRQTDRWTNRSVFYPTSQNDSPSGSPQTVNVYVGNEKLASFVLNTVKNDLQVW